MKRSRLVEAYYRYCTQGFVKSDEAEQISLLEREFAFKEKLLPMYSRVTNQECHESRRLEIERAEKIVVLKKLFEHPMLKDSVLVLKGLTIERLYHSDSRRFAFDADIVALEEHMPIINRIMLESNYDIYSSTPWVKDIKNGIIYKSFRFTKGYVDDRGFEIHVRHYPIDDNGNRIEYEDLSKDKKKEDLWGIELNIPSYKNAITIMLIQFFYKKNITVRDFVDFIILLESDNKVDDKEVIFEIIRSYDLGSAIYKVKKYINDNEIKTEKYACFEVLESIKNDYFPDSLPFSLDCSKIDANFSENAAENSRMMFESGVPINFYRLNEGESISLTNCFSIESNIGTFFGQYKGEFIVYENYE